MISPAKWFLLFLAAFLSVLCLFNAAPAQAQTTIWSATLTVKDAGSARLGCSLTAQVANRCNSSSVLTDNTFTYGGANYTISDFYLSSDATLTLGLTSGFATATDVLTLNVGNSQFAFASANVVGSSRNWANSGLSWTANQQVSLSLVEPPPLPTVSLSASPNPVPEGENVTVTATLSEALSGVVEIPVTNTGTIEIVRGPGVIVVHPRSMTGFEFFLAVQDCDTDNETFTVALNTARLPSSLRAGTPSSVTITIKDDGVPCTPPTNQPTDQPPPNTGGTGTGGGGGGTTPPRDTTPPEELSDTPCGESDTEDLEKFYEATEGDTWYDNENWNSQEPLEDWFGVETEDGEVVSLRLEENNLSGDMPTKELLCLTELRELALWGNDDLSGEVPDELVLAVERAALREIAEMLNINPEWFEDYEDPFNFEDWYEGVTTDDDGRVTELDLPGEIPESIISQFKKRREIMITTSDGGCALSPKDDSSAFSLFLLTLVVFAVLGRKKTR